MATTIARKRFISKRGGYESSESEIIIEISDDDSISISSSSDDEPIPQSQKPELTTTSWADELGDNHPQSYRKEPKRKEKRFHKRSDDSTMDKWVHDMYNEESDEDTKPFRPRSHRVGKPKKKFDHRKKKDDREFDQRKKDDREFDYRKDQKRDDRVVVREDSINMEEVSGSVKDMAIAEKVEQPRVRRTISFQAKQQLIASFTKNPPVRPTPQPQERKEQVISPIPEKEEIKVESRNVEHKLTLQRSNPDLKVMKKSDNPEKVEKKSERFQRDDRQDRWDERSNFSEQRDRRGDSRDSKRDDRLLEQDRLNDRRKEEKKPEDRFDREGRSFDRRKEEKKPEDRFDREGRSFDRRKDDRKERSFEKDERYERKKSNERYEREKERYERKQESNERYERKEERIDREDRKRYSKAFESKPPQPPQNIPINTSSAPPAESPDYKEEPKGVVVPTPHGGWAILNPSVDLQEQERKSNGKRRSSYPTATPIMQPMITVQPMMTQSGHMVLVTENGLCVPATPDMFQYQQWYDSLSTDSTQTYYFNSYYSEQQEKKTQ